MKSIYRKVVIKIGTSILTTKKNIFDKERLKDIVSDIIEILDRGINVVVVSSGAILCGMSTLGLDNRPKKLSKLQATAAIGQGLLMHTYQEFFSKKNKLTAQILLTWEDFDNRQRYLNAKNTLLNLLSYKVVPIVNENDSISTEEIKFGDNDRLSALVANLIEADLLLILSDVEGLMDKDKLIPLVSKITPQLKNIVKDTSKDVTQGGMLSKLEAAKIAIDSGIPCIVANGKEREIIKKIILQNKKMGTLFLPQGKMRSSFKKWIAFGTKPKGRIFVDRGAKEALIYFKCSLLPRGVTKIEGNFNKGEIVSIVNEDGKEFARGKIGYSSEELTRVKGQRYKKEVVHRDQLVILTDEYRKTNL